LVLNPYTVTSLDLAKPFTSSAHCARAINWNKSK
jgi:hypothetical protein